jgi:hypothetical protein
VLSRGWDFEDSGQEEKVEARRLAQVEARTGQRIVVKNMLTLIGIFNEFE